VRLRAEPDVRTWIPVNPYAQGSCDRLLQIFGLFEELMIRSETSSYKYYAYLANQWMRGTSLRELVANKIQWSKSGSDVGKVNDAIRDLFADLEDQLRYKYVKYTRLYSEVLRVVLLERGLLSRRCSRCTSSWNTGQRPRPSST